MKNLLKYLVLLSSTVVSTSAFSALSPGVINDFQGGTTEGWTHGKPSFSQTLPSTIGNSGPNGSGDTALVINSNGTISFSGDKLQAVNRSAAWAGAASAGITGLEMDLKVIHSGPDLKIRFAVSNGTGSSGSWWVSQTTHFRHCK